MPISADCQIATKDDLERVGGPDCITRTAANIHYRSGQPAFALFDFDTKGMPPEVADKLKSMSGFWEALCGVLPALRGVSHMTGRSTSAGLLRTDTGVELAGSNGLHCYVAVRNGTDIERFRKTVHERCWLAGLGWMMVGAAGQLLERSIVDRMVGAPERLVFEAPPVLEAPLSQDAESRRPIVEDGSLLDSADACPPLTIVEKEALRKMRAQAAQYLLPETHRAREAFIARRANWLAEHADLADAVARRVIERQTSGILLPDVELQFDDPTIAVVKVAEVLDKPARYESQTLADPIEGVEYGRCKAKIMLRGDGTPWIHSFAHGGASYELKYDAAAVRAAIERSAEPIEILAKLVVRADLDEVEEKQLIDDVAKRARWVSSSSLQG